MKFQTRLWLGMIVLFVFVPTPLIYGQTQTEKVADKKFWVVNGVFVASSIYDVESTFYVMDRCPTCSEAYPFMKPFVNAGKPATYAVIAVADIAIVYSSYYLKKEDKKFWFVIPVILAVTHTIAGTHNIRLAISF